jgi:murein tripeptide amidase MpaA
VKSIFDKYILKIVPMLNPDGVFVGNTRVSLAGVDLNRRWGSAVLDKSLHPEIFSLKEEMIKDKGNILAYLDLHGHSKQTSIFFYGNRL